MCESQNSPCPPQTNDSIEISIPVIILIKVIVQFFSIIRTNINVHLCVHKQINKDKWTNIDNLSVESGNNAIVYSKTSF